MPIMWPTGGERRAVEKSKSLGLGLLCYALLERVIALHSAKMRSSNDVNETVEPMLRNRNRTP